MDENDRWNCSICGMPSRGFGHNPEPLKPYEERCCDTCNTVFVIPARIENLRKHPLGS